MKKIITIFFILFFSSLIYTLTLKGIYGNAPAESIKNNLDQATKPFELSPERSRFLLTQNLVEKKSFVLSKNQAEAAYPDVGYYKGKFYIFFAPGISLFAVPFYIVGQTYNLAQVFSFGMIAIFAVLTLIFIYLICKDIFGLSTWLSLLAVIIYGFGSCSLGYATTMYQHQATAFFILSSFYGVWQYKSQEKWGWIWGIFIWCNYALAIFVDYPNGILMLPIMCYFLFSSIKIHRNEQKIIFSFKFALIFTSILFIVVTGLHGYYNYVNFGDWKRVSGSLLGYKAIKDRKLEQNDKQNEAQQLEKRKNPVKFFKEDNIVNGFYVLLISQERGIFIFSPIFILGILGIFSSLRNITLEKVILLSLIILNVFFYASWGDPWGGWAFGPRYLIPAMAPLSIFCAFWLSSIRYKLLNRFVVFALLLFSCAVSLLGAITSNAVPPKSEIDFLNKTYNLHIQNGFLRNLEFIQGNKSSSFFYNTFFSQSINLETYYWIILGVITFIIFCIIFIMPLFEKENKAYDKS